MCGSEKKEIRPELLQTVQTFDEMFRRHKKPLWIMGGMAIAAQLSEAHRDIVNDVDFITTDDEITGVIEEFEHEGYVVEEGWGTRLRVHKKDVRGDIAVLHVDETTGNFEAEGSSFPMEAFPNNEVVLRGVKMRPVSLEMLAFMKERAATGNGSKHDIDLAALKQELSRRGITDEHMEQFRSKAKLRGLDFGQTELTREQSKIANEKMRLLIEEYKLCFDQLYQTARSGEVAIGNALQIALPEEILSRVIERAHVMSKEDFMKYIHQKFNSYLTERARLEGMKLATTDS